MREFPSTGSDNLYHLISTLSDKTRLEIIALLMKYSEGLTAADISRFINKKIPSTIYQLDIIQASGLITNEMKLVSSIGREIKHWFLKPDSYQLLLKLDLRTLVPELLLENQLVYEVRSKYLDALVKMKKDSKIIELEDLNEFKFDVLSLIELQNGSLLKDKDKIKITQLDAKPLLLDALINKLRILLRNSNINEGYPIEICIGMLEISSDVANLVVNEMEKYYDIEFNYETQYVIRKA